MLFNKQVQPALTALLPTAPLQQTTFFKSARLLAAVALLMLTACEKEHHHDDSDKSAPVLTLNSPNNLQEFKQGDTLYIKGTVSDASLHELTITLNNDKDSTLLFSAAPVVHAQSSYTINTYWVCNVADTIQATLNLMAHDHAENSTSLKRSVRLLPK